MTPQDRGSLGYERTLAKYGVSTMNRWRRSGGRKPNPSLSEIKAGIEPVRARVTSKREVRPIDRFDYVS